MKLLLSLALRFFLFVATAPPTIVVTAEPHAEPGTNCPAWYELKPCIAEQRFKVVPEQYQHLIVRIFIEPVCWYRHIFMTTWAWWRKRVVAAATSVAAAVHRYKQQQPCLVVLVIMFVRLRIRRGATAMLCCSLFFFFLFLSQKITMIIIYYLFIHSFLISPRPVCRHWISPPCMRRLHRFRIFRRVVISIYILIWSTILDRKYYTSILYYTMFTMVGCGVIG